ncbi:hypothetical protein DFH27DRAFT_544223 [Peziza echinospora]|nr:hypothetical protein DFH27DRAFT_544223 [Peziza echinospora]
MIVEVLFFYIQRCFSFLALFFSFFSCYLRTLVFFFYSELLLLATLYLISLSFACNWFELHTSTCYLCLLYFI